MTHRTPDLVTATLEDQQADATALRASINNHLRYTLAKNQFTATKRDYFQALAYSIRDRLIDQWFRTQERYYERDVKRVYYLSIEFLLGRLLRDSGQYDQLLASVRDLHKSITALRGGSLLQSEAQYAEWNQKLAAWIQGVDELTANPTLLTPAVYENLSGEARELRDTLREFRLNPRKFLRLKIF